MIQMNDAVITVEMLVSKLAGAKEVNLCPHSRLTPMAQDYVREQGIRVTRETAPRQAPAEKPAPAPVAGRAKGRDAFRGIFCPNIVIFDEENRINHAEMERYVDWLIGVGINGLYPNGSTGEFTRLSWEERQEVVKLIADVNQGRVPILAGASEANLRDVLRMAEFYAGVGVDAISLVPPYYYPVSERSLFAYFSEVAEQSPLDILLYNIPQFTTELSLCVMEDLLVYDRIMGTKDSSRDMPRLINTMHRLRAHRPDYVVLVGCEEMLCPSVMMGASGGTIATSGIIPEVIVALYEKTRDGDYDRARLLQYRILDLINLMLLGVNFPEGFKTGVAARGFKVGPPRHVLSAAERDHLLNLEGQIGCILQDMGYPVQGARACPVTHLPPIVKR